MAPSDVAGVFSRYFIVGFVLPAFFVLVGLSVTLTDSFLPNAYESLGGGARIAVLGGAGLLGGLLLLGLNWQVFRAFEGYPFASRRERHPFNWIHGFLLARQRKAFDRLLQLSEDERAEPAARDHAAWKLDREFPPNAEMLLPTRFGNAVLAFETHSSKRWGLDSIGAWPRIDMLLSDREGEQQANARSEAAFFVNGSLLLALAGVLLVVNQFDAEPLSGLELVVLLIPFAASVVMARWAAGAATRWGSAVRSAIDLHRLELYEKLGVRTPTSFTDERQGVAKVLNQTLIYGAAIPDEYFAVPKPANEEEDE